MNNLNKSINDFNFKCQLLKYSKLIDISNFLDIEKITNYAIEFYTTKIKQYLINNIDDLKNELKNDDSDDSIKYVLIENITLLKKIKDITEQHIPQLTFEIKNNDNKIIKLDIIFNIISNSDETFGTFKPHKNKLESIIKINCYTNINNTDEYNHEIFNLKNTIKHECLHFIQYYNEIGFPSKLRDTYLRSNTNNELSYNELDVEFYPILYDAISDFNFFFGNIESKKIKSEIALIFIYALKPMKNHSVYNSVYRDYIKVLPFFKDLYNKDKKRWQKACKIFLAEVLK